MTAPCPWCGEPEVLEIADIWDDSNFLLNTCCGALLDSVSAEMADDPAWGRDLLRRLGAESLAGHRLRRVSDGKGCHPMLDWHLDLRPIGLAQARTFVARHHAHCPPPVAARWCHAAWSGRQVVGVVAAGNPVARAYMGRGIAEVNRLCVRRDIAPLLVWNAASMLYGAACRSAERAGYRQMITYTRADEEGTSLVAAGFECCGWVRGRSWHGTRAREAISLPDFAHKRVARCKPQKTAFLLGYDVEGLCVNLPEGLPRHRVIVVEGKAGGSGHECISRASYNGRRGPESGY